MALKIGIICPQKTLKKNEFVSVFFSMVMDKFSSLSNVMTVTKRSSPSEEMMQNSPHEKQSQNPLQTKNPMDAPPKAETHQIWTNSKSRTKKRKTYQLSSHLKVN